MTLKADNRLDVWLQYIQTQHARAIDLNLARVRRVWHALGSPTTPFTLLVAGTNGKGSSVAMLESVLHHAGYTTGAYTSPHLVHFNERIRLNRQPVDDAQIIAEFERIEQVRGQVPLTYFEFGTLVAMIIFSRNGVQAGILEVGLGGRLDATNIFNHQLALITSIGLDHQSWLGADREAIGGEKAGIIRYHGITVCSEPDPPRTVLQTAVTKHSRLFNINRDFRIESTAEVHHWRCNDPKLPQQWRDIGPFTLPLPGRHQLRNAAGVIMALVATRSISGISPRQIRIGLNDVRIEARQQVLANEPEIMADVAHNQEAVEMLRQNLSSRPVKGVTYVVMGILTDKPVSAIVSLLSPLVDRWYLATLDLDRGMTATGLQRIVKAVSSQAKTKTFASPVMAYRAVIGCIKPEDRLLILGSFHTVGDILQFRTLP